MVQVHLLDATYELFRAHFGRPPRTGIDGEAVGATLLALADIDPGDYVPGYSPIEGILL